MTISYTIGTRASCNGGNSLAPSISCTVGDLITVEFALSRGDTAGTALSPPSGWLSAESQAAPAGMSGNYQPITGIFYKIAASTTETCTIPGIPNGSYGYADIVKASSTLGTLVLSSAHTSNTGTTNGTSGNTGTTSALSGTENIGFGVVHPEDQVGNISSLAFPLSSGWTDVGHDAANNNIIAYASALKVGVTGTQSGSTTWTTAAKYAGSVAFFEVASSGTNVNPGVGSVAISGYAPTISQPKAYTPGAGTVALTGYAPTVGQPISAAPGAGALTLTGYAPAIAQPQSLAPGVGALSITGYAPTVTQSQAVAPAAGAVAISGYAPSISQPHSASPGAGSIVITGYAPTVTQSGAQSVLPGVGAVVLTGYAPTVTQGVTPPARNAGFEVGARMVSYKPLLQRILEARAERRVKPAKERAQKRAKAIEVEAARLVLEDDGAQQRFDELMAGWMAQRPVLPPPMFGQADPMQLFMAQVAFRIQQMQAEEQARARLAAQDEEDALMALLLA